MNDIPNNNQNQDPNTPNKSSENNLYEKCYFQRIPNPCPPDELFDYFRYFDIDDLAFKNLIQVASNLISPDEDELYPIFLGHDLVENHIILALAEPLYLEIISKYIDQRKNLVEGGFLEGSVRVEEYYELERDPSNSTPFYVYNSETTPNQQRDSHISWNPNFNRMVKKPHRSLDKSNISLDINNNIETDQPKANEPIFNLFIITKCSVQVYDHDGELYEYTNKIDSIKPKSESKSLITTSESLNRNEMKESEQKDKPLKEIILSQIPLNKWASTLCYLDIEILSLENLFGIELDIVPDKTNVLCYFPFTLSDHDHAYFCVLKSDYLNILWRYFEILFITDMKEGCNLIINRYLLEELDPKTDSPFYIIEKDRPFEMSLSDWNALPDTERMKEGAYKRITLVEGAFRKDLKPNDPVTTRINAELLDSETDEL